VFVPDIGYVDPYPVFNRLYIPEIAAVLGDQAINQRHPGTEFHQANGKIGPDEAQAAGYEYICITKGHGLQPFLIRYRTCMVLDNTAYGDVCCFIVSLNRN